MHQTPEGTELIGDKKPGDSEDDTEEKEKEEIPRDVIRPRVHETEEQVCHTGGRGNVRNASPFIANRIEFPDVEVEHKRHDGVRKQSCDSPSHHSHDRDKEKIRRDVDQRTRQCDRREALCLLFDIHPRHEVVVDAEKHVCEEHNRDNRKPPQ